MGFQSVKGTRDFYPEQMGIRNWLLDAWRRVSLRNGFVEFDGPVLEYLDLYRAKSGDEIVSQLFNMTDRGGRQLAMRPEITPTLARMVNAKINSLPRPVKWFSVPRLFRAENPQKGRLREFFQWNVDIIGGEEGVSDAECIFTAVDALQELGLTQDDAQVRYSSRRLLSAVLRSVGLDDPAIGPVLAVLDKRSKVPPEAFGEMLTGAIPEQERRDVVLRFLDAGGGGEDVLAGLAGRELTPEIQESAENLRLFRRAMEGFGIAGWCRYDTSVVRGLAYYTGVVYEIFDAKGSLRAVAGGGRYDNLLEVLGGPKVGATGFGMGDPVLAILLEEKGKLPDLSRGVDCFVLGGGEGAEFSADDVLGLTAGLRRLGVVTDYTIKSSGVGKLLKEANRRQARYAAIVRGPNVALKNLVNGQQTEMPVAELLAAPGKFLV